MSAQDAFMTLVDAATSLIDEKKEAAKREGLGIKASEKPMSETSVTRHLESNSSSTPPPDMPPNDRAALVSPSTPRTNNRSPPEAAVAAAAAAAAGPKPSFAKLLMDVLMDETLNDIITFLPDGDAFAILDPRAFAEDIMPQYFGIRK